MIQPPTSPHELARIMRQQAVAVAPLSDHGAMMRYADWLDDMTELPPVDALVNREEEFERIALRTELGSI